MSVLDDARRLANGAGDDCSGPIFFDARVGKGRCGYCYQLIPEQGHDSQCPVPRFPKIVAALESVERVAEYPGVTFSDHHEDNCTDRHTIMCMCCGEQARCDCTEEECDDPRTWAPAVERNYQRIVHDQDCVVQALVAALKGKEVGGVISVYAASPECQERHCEITMWWDVERLAAVYRHGQNPEAVLIVDRFSYRHDPAADVRQRFREFAERCHRYYDEGVMA